MEIRANQKGYIFDSLRGIHLDSPGYIKINCKLFEWMIFSFSSLSLKEWGGTICIDISLNIGAWTLPDTN